MSVQVQSADGVIHQFPDGTSPAVIDRAMKAYAAEVRQHEQDPLGQTKSLATGVLKGVSGVAGIPGDVLHGLDTATVAGLNAIGLPVKRPNQTLPTGRAIAEAVAKPFGGLRSALTTGERLNEAVGSVGASTLMGPGSIASRVLTGVGGGLGAGAAGEAVPQDSALRPWAEMVGSLVGGMGAGALERGLLGAPSVSRPAIPGRPDIAPKMAQRGTDYVLNHLDRAGVSPSNLGSGAPNIPEFTTAESLGPGAVDATLTLASRPGTTAGTITDLVARRNEGRRGRVFDAFEAATGIHPEDADANLDSITHHGQQVATPLYDRALASTNPVMTPRLADLLKRGRIKAALKDVADDLDTRGIDPASQGINLNGQSTPTAMAWDLIKKHLQSQVKRDGMGRVMADSAAPGNVGIASATAALTDELKNAIPGYANALAAAGDHLSIGTAFRNGQKVIDGTKFSPHAISQMVDKLQPGDRYGFYAGIASKLFGKGNIETTLATNQPLQQKVIAALGPKAGQEFIDTAKAELAAMRSGNRMVPRNQSATGGIGQNVIDQDQLDRAHGMVDAAHAVGHVLTGNVLGAAGPALRLATRLSKAGTMPEDARNAAGELLTLPPSSTASYLQQVRPISRAKPPRMSEQTLRLLLGAYAAGRQGQR